MILLYLLRKQLCKHYLKYSMIRLSEETKTRLKNIEGGSYEDKISMMLDYFSKTGVSPDSKIVSPVHEVQKQSERIIKIIRNIELKKISPTLKAVEILLQKGGGDSTTIDTQFDAAELEKIGLLRDEFEKKKNENSELKKQVEILRNDQNSGASTTSNNADFQSDFDSIKNIILDLNDAKMNTQLKADSFLINKNIFNNSYKKIIEVTNKYVR